MSRTLPTLVNTLTHYEDELLAQLDRLDDIAEAFRTLTANRY